MLFFNMLVIEKKDLDAHFYNIWGYNNKFLKFESLITFSLIVEGCILLYCLKKLLILVIDKSISASYTNISITKISTW